MEHASDYTRTTRAWLNGRFKALDAEGVYWAHQPIYGFRSDHSAGSRIPAYVRTHAILEALAGLNFHTLLDVGAAEGWTSQLSRELLGIDVQCTDLSDEACARAHDLFGLTAVCSDAHRLPYRDGAFDVVLCSETLEHVVDPALVVSELLRVARKAVVLTVPHEDLRRRSCGARPPHAHLHAFSLASFDYLRPSGVAVAGARHLAWPVRLLAMIVEGAPWPHRQDAPYPRWAVAAYNAVARVARRTLGSRTGWFLACLDVWLRPLVTSHTGLRFILMKDPACRSSRPRRVSLWRILNAAVPLHRPSSSSTAS